MELVVLGATGTTTTRLGFGCSSIMGGLSRRRSLHLLESAYDAGIRHFDAAPMYGFGEAERCLGEFLVRHPGSVTVTTKFGMPPISQSGLMRIARSLTQPVFEAVPTLRRRFQRSRSVADPAPRGANPIFTAAQAREALERSLTSLRRDRIDLWLLHEVRAIDLFDRTRSDALLRMMEDAVREGKVGLFGVGSERGDLPELLQEHAAFCHVLQSEWSVLNPVVRQQAPVQIHHRALSGNFTALVDRFRQHPERCRQWSGEVGEDLAQPATLARLMLKASYLLNPSSLLLFSSRSPGHIVANVAAAADRSIDIPAQRLYELFQREQHL